MSSKISVRAATSVTTTLLFGTVFAGGAGAYPPGVGITSKSTSCLSCHADNGRWADTAFTVVDILASRQT